MGIDKLAALKTNWIILIYLLLIGPLSAQKEDHQWMYNFSDSADTINYPEWAASVIDFNTLPPKVYKNLNINLDVKECNASICDEHGKLLLVSNGQAIYNKGEFPITKGDTINYGNNWETFTREFPPGNFETTGFRVPQQIGFIPQPESDTILAVYQNNDVYLLDSDNNYIHLLYAKVVKGENGEYEVFDEDILLNDTIYSGGKTTACKHANGRDWWLLQFNRDTIYSYLIDPSGIRLNEINILPFSVVKNTHGQSKFSPDGSKYAYFGVRQNNRVDGAQIMISDFDRCTGRLLNPKATIYSSLNNLLDNGLEFSPDGNLVYISTQISIIQMDLNEEDVFGSMQVVAEHNNINNCSVDNGPNPKSFGQMQLAPDNKIYISLAAQCNDVHIIHSPNERGEVCNMEQNAIILPTFVMGTIPTLNTYRLGPLDGSSCDTLGLDNNPVSRFWYEQDSSDFLTAQFWDVSYFRPEEWLWTFGDGASSTERHPFHNYSEKGIYEVCLTVSNENSSNTSCQELNLGMVSAVEENQNIQISLFPNPVENETRILIQNYLPKDARLVIYDNSGRSVSSYSVNGGATILDFSNLNAGLYFWELVDQNILLDSGKVVKI